MKRQVVISLLILSFITLSSSIQYITEENKRIYGTWWTSDMKAKIALFKNSAGNVNGKIVWVKNPNHADGKPKKDINNPIKSKRKQTIVGLVILSDLKYKGDNTWEDGTVYDPKTGKSHSCILNLTDNNNLEVKGYVGFSFIGRTETFTRVQ